MIATIVGWIGFALLILVFMGSIYLYRLLRNASDGIVETSTDQFFEAANSLMETPSDLPDEVLTALKTMIAAGNDPKAHWKFLRAARSERVQKDAATGRKAELQIKVEGMRPELHELFMKAQVAWLGLIIHRNVYTALRVHLAFLRLRSRGLDQKNAEAETSAKLLRGFDAHAC